jgi:hypothetical protein
MNRIAACLLGLIGACAPVGAPRAADAVHLGYDLYAAGLNAAHIRVGAGIEANTYRVNLAYRTTGLVGFFFRGRQLTSVEGDWAQDKALPRRFLSHGVVGGNERLTDIEYRKGAPVVRQLIPPNETEREPVPPELQANTIDTLSAIIGLVRSSARTGRCESGLSSLTHTFDGRRAANIHVRTAGYEILPPTERSSFSGRALRCDFESRMLAGFYHGDTVRKPLTGTVWLADVVSGAPHLPVRLTIETRWFGDAVVYLSAANAAVDTRIAAW